MKARSAAFTVIAAIALAHVALARAAAPQDVPVLSPLDSTNPGILPVAVLPYLDRSTGMGDEIRRPLLNGMIRALIDTGRFQVRDQDRVSDALDEAGGRTDLRSPLEVAQIGRAVGVPIVVYGEILQADCTVDRFKGKKHDTYKATANVMVRDTAIDVTKGSTWIASTIATNASTPDELDEYPDHEARADLCRKAALQTIQKFVRRLVPRIVGHVVAATASAAVLDIGARDGVGLDTDIAFVRVQPLLDRSGNPVSDPHTGQPLTTVTPIAAAVHGDPRKTDAVIGRVIPGSITETSCQCTVGFYSKYWMSRKFSEAKPCLDALKAGDTAQLAPRPDGQ